MLFIPTDVIEYVIIPFVDTYSVERLRVQNSLTILFHSGHIGVYEALFATKLRIMMAGYLDDLADDSFSRFELLEDIENFSGFKIKIG